MLFSKFVDYPIRNLGLRPILPIGIRQLVAKVDSNEVFWNSGKNGIIEKNWYHRTLGNAWGKTVSLKSRPYLAKVIFFEEANYISACCAKNPLKPPRFSVNDLKGRLITLQERRQLGCGFAFAAD